MPQVAYPALDVLTFGGVTKSFDGFLPVLGIGSDMLRQINVSHVILVFSCSPRDTLAAGFIRQYV